MAPQRRPGLTMIVQKVPPGDPAAALIWTAVPVEHCTSEMLAFRRTAEPMRVADDAVRSSDGLPRSDLPEHPTIQHWQAGGVVLFGYASLRAAKYAEELLSAVYIARSGRIAVRDP
jgi:hypothetical protein